MNWKLFLSASVAALLGLVPQNGISCAGGDEDPQDYFTSFFSRAASGADPSYRPFYYTMVRSFYDSEDPADSGESVNAAVLEEWQRYCGGARQGDVTKLVMTSTRAGLSALRDGLSKGRLPADYQQNSAATALLRMHKTEAVEYLQLAKEIEGLTSGASSAWDEAPPRDSAALVRQMQAAGMAGAVSADPFLKPRWAFLSCKAAFYANRYADCLRLYDKGFPQEGSAAVQPLALSYKGGALFRLNRNREAAYAFSKAFSATAYNRRGNFLGFLWSTHYADSTLRAAYVAEGRNGREQAALTGLFGLYGEAPALRNLQEVYRLDPASPLLPLLASREISKVEEQYLAPLMGRTYIGYREEPAPAELRKQRAEGRARAATLARILAGFSNDSTLRQRAYYAAGAGYMYLLDERYDASRSQLAAAETLKPSGKQQDQLRMLRLLIAANEPKQLSAGEEAALLPAVQWLTAKAKTDDEYAPFLRNFFSELLVKRYTAQGDRARANLALAVGSYGTDYLHNELTAGETQRLYRMVDAPATPWERFLTQKATINRNGVIESLGTAYLREGKYAQAIEWLQRADSLPKMQGSVYDADWNETTVNVDPFFDYLNDRQRYEKRLPQAYTKLTFARKMKELHDKAARSTDPDSLAQVNYRLGSAYYNMSQYGNAWMAVSWDRSGADWNEGDYKTAWQKDFFGVHRARQYYEQAYKAARNRDFKAACYFMMAKCTQKALPRPSWNNLIYEQWEQKNAEFEVKFRNNPMFPGFVKDFGDTKFYQYTYKRCSYLRDFVQQQSVKK
ncbi:MAG: hypothetical protein EOO11_16775 [Chitinophagaceae bacterium]|nr:MAG: hypothetical protein EOO11_16775 [Chitinophagaceae bacterium]